MLILIIATIIINKVMLNNFTDTNTPSSHIHIPTYQVRDPWKFRASAVGLY